MEPHYNNLDCPNCGLNLDIPDEVAGKDFLCPGCGARLNLPKNESGSSDPFDRFKWRGGKTPAGSRPLSDPKPRPQASPPKQCPSCHKPMAEDAVICIECGYDTRKSKLRMKDRPTPPSSNESQKAKDGAPQSTPFSRRDERRTNASDEPTQRPWVRALNILLIIASIILIGDMDIFKKVIVHSQEKAVVIPRIKIPIATIIANRLNARIDIVSTNSFGVLATRTEWSFDSEKTKINEKVGNVHGSLHSSRYTINSKIYVPNRSDTPFVGAVQLSRIWIIGMDLSRLHSNRMELYPCFDTVDNHEVFATTPRAAYEYSPPKQTARPKQIKSTSVTGSAGFARGWTDTMLWPFKYFEVAGMTFASASERVETYWIGFAVGLACYVVIGVMIYLRN